MKLKVKVIAGSSQDKVIGYVGELLKLKVKAQARSGKANQAIINLLASEFNVSKNDVTLMSGLTSNIKVVDIKIENTIN